MKKNTLQYFWGISHNQHSACRRRVRSVQVWTFCFHFGHAGLQWLSHLSAVLLCVDARLGSLPPREQGRSQRLLQVILNRVFSAMLDLLKPLTEHFVFQITLQFPWSCRVSVLFYQWCIETNPDWRVGSCTLWALTFLLSVLLLSENFRLLQSFVVSTWLSPELRRACVQPGTLCFQAWGSNM